jgi:zinc and cadmium transporter
LHQHRQELCEDITPVCPRESGGGWCGRRRRSAAQSMDATFFSIVSVTAVSLVSVLALASLSLSDVRLRKVSASLISFAAGTLLGDAFIHLIPTSFGFPHPPIRQSLLMLGGMMLFFIVEKFMRHRHGALHAEPPKLTLAKPELATINLLGDAIHNFIDGVLIAASYLADLSLGLTTTVAVLCHEIPQELGDFSILTHSGISPRKAVLFNFGCASMAILGTVVTLLMGSVVERTLVTAMLPITAGGFVYLAAADLIPELQHDRSFGSLITQSGLMCFGMTLMAALSLWE